MRALGRRSNDWASRPEHRSRILKFTAALPQAIADADLVQENGPERIDFKQKLYGQLDELLPPDVIIASSSSGLKMSDIQSGAASASGALRHRPSVQSPALDSAG